MQFESKDSNTSSLTDMAPLSAPEDVPEGSDDAMAGRTVARPTKSQPFAFDKAYKDLDVRRHLTLPGLIICFCEASRHPGADSPQVFDLEGTMFGASGDYLDAFSMDLLDETANLSDGKPARAHLLRPLCWRDEAG